LKTKDWQIHKLATERLEFAWHRNGFLHASSNLVRGVKNQFTWAKAFRASNSGVFGGLCESAVTKDVSKMD
jgi:hypothetical protein